MPIDPAHLARSLGALDTLDVEGGFTGTLQQVLGSARTLLDADMAGLMLVDHTGTLRWASCSNSPLWVWTIGSEQLAHAPAGSPSPNGRPRPSQTAASNLAGASSPRRASMQTVMPG